MWRADAFWQYSVALYAVDSVEEGCLRLQEEFGLNVNIVLLCCYLDAQNAFIEDTNLVMLTQLESDLLRRLERHRKLRKQAKMKGLHQYKRLLEQELMLEKQHQKSLIESLNTFSLTQQSRSNLCTYAALTHHFLPPQLCSIIDLLSVASASSLSRNKH